MNVPNFNIYVNCDISFGGVPVGSTVVKTYPLKNTDYEVATFHITRNSFTNPIYYVYDINRYEVNVEGGKKFTLKISYTPTVPGSQDFDYFLISNRRSHLCRLSLRGECIGPSLSVSIRNLHFCKLPNLNHIKKVFVLTNKSQVSATYQFDVSEEQGVFHVEPTKGTLEPQDYAYITVKFLPTEPRFFSRQLICLVWNDEPLILNLVGLYSKTEYNFHEAPLRYYPFPYEETVGFKAFFSDSVSAKKVPPPVSMTINYLDFGALNAELLCNTLTFSFTNHMDSVVKVEWEESTLAQIVPRSLEIPSKQSALYECKLQSDEDLVLEAVIINGQVSWFPNSKVETFSPNVPIPINVRMIGYNSPQSQAWVPSITITPSNVVLPLTLPGFCSWTTFKIDSHGHLPVLYKLVPPDRTNFIMKPMVGLIRTFQIIAVQLECNSTESKSFIEKWGIELNGQKQEFMPIYVKAQTDYPNVRVNYQNAIWFDSIQPGTKTTLLIPLRNLSSTQTYYEFILSDNIGIDPPTGILAANEEIFVTATYISNFEQIGLQEVDIICRIRCYNQGASIGEYVDIVVKVVIEIIYSELCAFPTSYSRGEVEYGTLIKTSFYIFNFGKSNVNFKLHHDYNPNEVTIAPVMGRCGPSEKIMVKVEFVAKRPGNNFFFITYNNRSYEYSGDIVPNEAGKLLFSVDYTCVFPTIQFEEILDKNFGPLFSNVYLWDTFNIKKLNTALAETIPGEIQQVNMYIPSSEVSEKLFYMVFSLKNCTNFVSQITIKRRQVCDCPLIEQKGFTFRSKVYDCFHRNLFVIEPTVYYVMPKATAVVTFTTKYFVEGEHQLSYTLDLGHNRTVHIDIHMECIGKDSYILSTYDLRNTINLGYVFIGLREPPVFAYWLFNNTSKPVGFKIDDEEIQKLCLEERFPVLKCVNSKGIIEPFSTAPLLLKFWPIEVKYYKVKIRLFLGMKERNVRVVGHGTMEKSNLEFEDIMNLQSRPVRNNLLSLSVDHLMIEPILVTNFTERMFFIRNESKTQHIQYSWMPCVFDGLVKVEPIVTDGILNPRESHPVFIKILSLNEPCSINVSLVLEFIDFDQLEEYKRIKALMQIKANKSLEEFCITESKSEIVPIETITEPEIPPKYYIVLPLTINIVGESDKDSCIQISEQLKQRPWQGIHTDVNKFVEKYFQERKIYEKPIHPPLPTGKKEAKIEQKLINADIVRMVLEHALGDAVFSEYFYHVLRNLKFEPCPFYSQIHLDTKRREKVLEKETKKFLAHPDLLEVNTICEEVLIDVIQNTFQLGPRLKNESQSSTEF